MEFNMKRMNDYEKIQTVGKGAFGTAVLYRKKSTDKMVVLKEINTADLSPEERQMALNEVEVLSSLNHENIIGYGGSFIENGFLMIEMEFANGGTLNQLLNKRETYIPENDVLVFLKQIASAIAHMHKNNILHRDLKTANVFLSSKDYVKIGDFGISKILSTNVQAQTVLGTPYYISPEMCEGKEYNEKSDIWAMGCILYEICCLHRAFQASSLSALVTKIMQGNYKPVPVGYSRELRKLISLLLDKNPTKRPSAQDVVDLWIPKIISAHDKYDDNVGFDNLQLLVDKSNRNVRSVLFEMKHSSDTEIQPVCLPPKVKILNVATGSNHFIVVTEDNLVFAWGEGEKGQLGSGKAEKQRSHPMPVITLLNKNIIMAGAGDDFSLFLSADGKVWSCGNGTSGVLGHSNWNDYYEPEIIDSLILVQIVTIQCGSDHAAAVSKDGVLYMWGCGNKGQIGNSSTSDVNFPVTVELPKTLKIFSLHLGYKATMIITTKGKLYACGWNNKNRLGLFKKTCIRKFNNQLLITKLKKVTCLSGKIVNCSIGESHCTIVLENSYKQTTVFSMGCIDDPFAESLPEIICNPTKVSDLKNISIKDIKCGPMYSIISTSDNCILFWGMKYESSKDDLNVNEMRDTLEEVISNTSMVNHVSHFIKEPTPILCLYASKEQLSKGSYIKISGIYPVKYKVLITVETTAILINRNENGVNTNNEEMTEMTENIPTWIKHDIMQSKFIWIEN